MNELSWIAIILGSVVILVVLSPFFYGEGGWLLDAAKEDSVEQLRERQRLILERWLQDEADATQGLITAREWNMRQVYLTNRYVDATRRIDWLTAVQSEVGS